MVGSGVVQFAIHNTKLGLKLNRFCILLVKIDLIAVYSAFRLKNLIEEQKIIFKPRWVFLMQL